MRGTNAVVMSGGSDEDDEGPPCFKPLDSKFSYFATQGGLEVAPTKDVQMICQNSTGSKSKFQKDYGAPTDNSINTRHVSGKKVDKKHALYALSAGMMLGVRECVGGMSDLANDDDFRGKTPLTLEEECLRVEKFKFPAGEYFISSKMATLPYRYKFKAYSPKIFHRIRDIAGVDKQLFLHSICGGDAFIEFVSNAKSGQFFFYSPDGRYMIKTMKQEEKTFLRQILPHYYNHLRNNPHSFISHFYGMYRVKIPDLGRSVHFIIMKSVFNTELEIHKIWDLKGSTLGRRAKRGDSVHKDLDILDEGRKIYVGREKKETILDILRSDSKFLAKMQIMDYSLLLGAHLSTSGFKMNSRSILSRSNTPMRRKQFFENNEDESVMQHFLSKSSMSYKPTIETISESTSNETPESASYNDTSDEEDDDDDDDDDCEFAGKTRNGPVIPDLTKTLSSIDMEEFRANISKNSYSSRDDLGIESTGSVKEIYFGGIIDILQFYNARKWGETVMKKSIGNDEKEMSCVSPDVYASRFVDFIGNLME